MKKLILSGMMMFATIYFTNAQEMKDFPSQAQNVLNKHYANMEVKKIDIDKDDREEMYQIKYTNGTKIDFNAKGEITKIKGNDEIPSELIPSRINDYVAKNRPDNKVITEWEFDGDEHEIEFKDGTEMEFDKNGKFKEEYKFLGMDW